ncbi:hypothetical protein [Comamonas aquatica]|uniref:Uncharacterized protein n=2 Tax=Comamonas aquatica TaxID=225991 RepID=A0AA42HSM2_9BURK|nr:hypothetical protein [Comamonas aquatica]MDH0363554.1 hypothetical protein [Comamonas aquatica]MDH0372178.1 hypothetical protein [Comamonas aquatica]MDH0382169.1 hypothetical protein [Comamonas aquatica]MDH0900061.1 hypothetical protein [Comamonas aquatica]MDH1379970.1 hypothetical protein [Comamonas aquatica]
MTTLHCELPLPRSTCRPRVASNQDQFHVLTMSLPPSSACHGNVRLMRRPKDTDRARFALSGKLADVCAALEALAAQEARHRLRCAAN